MSHTQREPDPDVYGAHVHVNMEDVFHFDRVEEVAEEIRGLNRLSTAFEVDGRRCMNVGTGVESMSMIQLGARSVDLFNSSESELDRFKRMFADHAALPRVTPEVHDIVAQPLPVGRYGIGFVNGVAHHTANVRAAVTNCVRSIEPGGHLYLSVYRQFGFRWFIARMMRKLNFLPSAEVSGYAARKVEQGAPNKLALIFTDDLLCNFMQLYDVQDYAALFNELGVVDWKLKSPIAPPFPQLRMPNFLHFLLGVSAPVGEIDVESGACSPNAELDILAKATHRTSEGKALVDCFHSSPLHHVRDPEVMLDKLMELALLTPVGFKSEAGYKKRNQLLADILASDRQVHFDTLLKAYKFALETRQSLLLG